MFENSEKVVVVSNTFKVGKPRKRKFDKSRDKYIGQQATVNSTHSSLEGYTYTLEFLNEELQKQNIQEGNLYFHHRDLSKDEYCII